MATMTMSRPAISSPLADPSHNTRPAAQRIVPRPNVSFPTSRALRPFPTISHALHPTAGKKPPVKIIEPPQNQMRTFLLDLTQAEFSRQE
ncbi:hypothetical protein LshimejAT787_0306920 [Lyophyllum shimeji]|uniref:Uncharacterized protein n=1 Tax=Lyophyllum shimeji TaxID=47721 RepID=A0A9P3PJ50_LYOSH|nr:hypothetical protein LshimejAT787_0306920 [Lyophyllum shimeji]